MNEREGIQEILNTLIDQEIEYQTENKGKFNKDRVSLINSLAEYVLAKQQRTTESTEEIDTDHNIV